MVLDHQNRVAYTALSHRSNPKLVDRFCKAFDYEPCLFRTADDQGAPIYHTNVLLCVAQHFALVGLDWVHPEDRAPLLRRLQTGGRTVIELSPDQIRSFADDYYKYRPPAPTTITNNPSIKLTPTSMRI